MSDTRTYFERDGIKLTDEALTIGGKDMPVCDISSFDLADSGINKGNLAVVALIGISGYSVLWFCSGNNSFIALDNMTGVFCLGIVVFSCIIVLRSLGRDKESVIFTVRTKDGKSKTLRIKDVGTAIELEDSLRKLLGKNLPVH